MGRPFIVYADDDSCAAPVSSSGQQPCTSGMTESFRRDFMEAARAAIATTSPGVYPTEDVEQFLDYLAHQARAAFTPVVEDFSDDPAPRTTSSLLDSKVLHKPSVELATCLITGVGISSGTPQQVMVLFDTRQLPVRLFPAQVGGLPYLRPGEQWPNDGAGQHLAFLFQQRVAELPEPVQQELGTTSGLLQAR